MEDGKFLSADDKKKLEELITELATLKIEHKAFAAKKNGLTPEDREKWRVNSTRTNNVHIEIKDLRFKNVLEAARG